MLANTGSDLCVSMCSVPGAGSVVQGSGWSLAGATYANTWASHPEVLYKA